MVNQNIKYNWNAALDCVKYDEIVFDGMVTSTPGQGSDDNPITAEIAWLLQMAKGDRVRYEGDVFSSVFLPVHDTFESDRKVVAVMRLVLHWASYFEDLLPVSTQGVVFVLDNKCHDPFTYRIDGANAYALGPGDLHETKFDEYMRTTSFAAVDTISDGTTERTRLRFDKCQYEIRVYPSSHMETLYKTKTPLVITMSVAFVFGFAVLMFFAYDRLVEKRQRVLMEKAKRTHAIVASLFPKNIRDQILSEDGELQHGGLLGAKNNIKSFVKGGMDDNNLFGQMPIADLYPESTVMVSK